MSQAAPPISGRRGLLRSGGNRRRAGVCLLSPLPPLNGYGSSFRSPFRGPAKRQAFGAGRGPELPQKAAALSEGRFLPGASFYFGLALPFFAIRS